VWPLVVVEGKVFGETSLGFVEVLVGLQEDVLVLHGAPRSLRKDIVHTSATAIHANADILGL